MVAISHFVATTLFSQHFLPYLSFLHPPHVALLHFSYPTAVQLLLPTPAMHVISRDAKRRLVVDHHATPPSFPSQLHDPPSLVLFLPEVLFQIGRLLGIHELWFCSLVCATWHSLFSPFLDWMALDNLTENMKKSNHRCGSCNGAAGYDPNICWPFFYAILQRVSKPDAAFGMHSLRYTYLSNSRLEYHGSDSNLTAPSAPRVEAFCVLTEKCHRLSYLHLNMNQEWDVQPRQPCGWAKVLQDKTEIDMSVQGEAHSSSAAARPKNSRSHLAPPLSMTYHQIQSPNWPHLSQVSLHKCHLEYSFIRVLLSNAPKLHHIYLLYVSFSEPETYLSTDQRTDVIIQLEEKLEGHPGQLETNNNLKNSCISEMSLWYVKGLKFADVLLFASQLPELYGFRCYLEEKATKSSTPPSEQESSATLGNFKTLRSLALHNSPCKDTTAVFQSAQSGIASFKLLDSPVDAALIQALGRNPHTKYLQEIEFCNIVLLDCENIVHLLLYSLPRLKIFRVCGGAMICDPEILQQTPWVCSGLEELSMKPKCDGGGQRYSAQESQNAFLNQLTSLKRLRFLDFEVGDEEGEVHGFAPETSLDLLGSLPRLCTLNLGLKTYRRMTEKHAGQILKWPNLRLSWSRVLFGVPVNEKIPFMEYAKKQLRNVKLTRYLD